jgi:hypothetical protein
LLKAESLDGSAVRAALSSAGHVAASLNIESAARA